MLRLVYLFVCLMLASGAVSAQQVTGLLIDQAQNAQGEQANPGTSSSNASSADAPALSINPLLVRRVLNVYVTGLPAGNYTMGIRRADGTLITQWTGVLTGTNLVIDIEKVETGILTFFLQWSGGELSGTFRHLP
jgi:hypothetical protein